MAGRRVVQIAAVPETDHSLGGLFGICADGSAWVLAFSGDTATGMDVAWTRLPDIPQDAPTPDGNGAIAEGLG